jgi:hypothetical protein
MPDWFSSADSCRLSGRGHVPPETLREQIQACIDEHLDYSAFQRLETVEAAEKETLDTIVGRFRGEEDDE